MIKHFVLQTVVWMITVTGLTQTNPDTVDINWGPKVVRGKTERPDYVGSIAGQSYFHFREVKFAGFFHSVIQVNENSKITEELTLKTGKIDNDLDYEDVFVLGQNLYVLASSYDKDSKFLTAYMLKVNTTTMELVLPKIKIADIYCEYRNFTVNSYQIRFSQNKKFIVFFIENPLVEGVGKAIEIKVYTDKLDLAWQGTFPSLIGDNRFDPQFVEVDNSGNVCALGPNLKSKQLYMKIFSEDMVKPKDLLIDIGDVRLVHLRMRYGYDGDIVCAGTYSSTGGPSVNGTLFFKVNLLRNKVEGFQKLSFSENQERESGKYPKPNGLIPPYYYNYDLHDIVITPHGETFVAVEQWFVDMEKKHISNGQSSSEVTLYSFRYDDIFLYRFNSADSFAWTVRIPKRQYTTNDEGYFSSFKMFENGGKLMLLYNDQPCNFVENQPAEKLKMLSVKNGVCVLLIVSENGQFTRKELINLKDLDLLPSVKWFEKCSEDTFVLLGKRSKTFRFARATIK